MFCQQGAAETEGRRPVNAPARDQLPQQILQQGVIVIIKGNFVLYTLAALPHDIVLQRLQLIAVASEDRVRAHGQRDESSQSRHVQVDPSGYCEAALHAVRVVLPRLRIFSIMAEMYGKF